MKNKDKYDLTTLTFRPRYMITGCGKKITKKYWFDVLQDNVIVAKGIEAKDSMLPYIFEWLEIDDGQ